VGALDAGDDVADPTFIGRDDAASHCGLAAHYARNLRSIKRLAGFLRGAAVVAADEHHQQ
jgi:hypothetical protein